MQFRLRSLFILTAIVCVYLGVINAPPFIALPLFCALVWVTPAYWVAGLIYGRDARRAFFIGGISGGAIPYLAMAFYTIVAGFDIFDGFPFRNLSRGGFGEAQVINFLGSLFIFSPVLISFLGAWLSLGVYYSLRPIPPPPMAGERES